MKIIVTGDRNTTDQSFVYRCLDLFAKGRTISLIVEGGQRQFSRRLNKHIGGVDYWARCWAEDRGIDCKTEPADWDSFGPAAGPIRNREMVDKYQPDAVVALPGGKGTKNMRDTALKKGIPLYVIAVGTSGALEMSEG